jgi:glycosyltransferase involved in cell wall biosynthesis
MRILYIHATLVPPPLDLQTDRFSLLSKALEGDILQPVWFKSPQEVEAVFGPGSYPIYVSGRFRYHWFLGSRYHGLRGRLAQFWFYLRKGVQLHRQKSFDCIVTYSHMTTGLMGAVVKLVTGAKLIVEVATSPDLVYITDRPRPSFHDRIMKLYSDLCLHLSVGFCDRAHLLYPTALSSYPALRRVKSSIFHEFVPVSRIPAHEEDSGRFVLMVGSPWYLKGADRLIEAFRRLAPDFPDVKLKLLGWYPDRSQLDMLTGGSTQIEILPVRPNAEALKVISRCEILVQPSRCEGMGRTVLEAMGAGVPVIGSDVGGIPHILRDGESGFIVPGGDPRGLEARLRQLLLDGDLRKRLGARGYALAHTELNEQVYVERFTEMVEAVVQGKE